VKQIQLGSMCNLIIQIDNPDGSKVATGCIESLDPTEMVKPYGFDAESELGDGWALVRVKTLLQPKIETVVSTIMRKGLVVDELVTWRISYLTP
jgi:hypothetical protein